MDGGEIPKNQGKGGIFAGVIDEMAKMQPFVFYNRDVNHFRECFLAFHESHKWQVTRMDVQTQTEPFCHAETSKAGGTTSFVSSKKKRKAQNQEIADESEEPPKRPRRSPRKKKARRT